MTIGERGGLAQRSKPLQSLTMMTIGERSGLAQRGKRLHDHEDAVTEEHGGDLQPRLPRRLCLRSGHTPVAPLLQTTVTWSGPPLLPGRPSPISICFAVFGALLPGRASLLLPHSKQSHGNSRQCF